MLSKETKIGLAVIGVLLFLFTTALFKRLLTTPETTVVSKPKTHTKASGTAKAKTKFPEPVLPHHAGNGDKPSAKITAPHEEPRSPWGNPQDKPAHAHAGKPHNPAAATFAAPAGDQHAAMPPAGLNQIGFAAPTEPSAPLMGPESTQPREQPDQPFAEGAVGSTNPNDLAQTIDVAPQQPAPMIVTGPGDPFHRGPMAGGISSEALAGDNIPTEEQAHTSPRADLTAGHEYRDAGVHNPSARRPGEERFRDAVAEPARQQQPQPSPFRTGPHSATQSDPLTEANSYNTFNHRAPGNNTEHRPHELPHHGTHADSQFDAQQAAPKTGLVQQPGGRATYVVQPGDNYWVISQKVYGTGAYFKALEKDGHQRDRVGHLRPGEIVSIPGVHDLQRRFPDLCPKAGGLAPAVDRPATFNVSTSRQLRTEGGVYVVEDGDTLFDIARYELGKASRWTEIYQLNREQIGDDFDHLSAGMQLQMPDAANTPDSVTRGPAAGIRR